MTARTEELHDQLADQLDQAATLVPHIERSIGDFTNWEQVLDDLDRLTGLADAAKAAAQRLAELQQDRPAQ